MQATTMCLVPMFVNDTKFPSTFPAGEHDSKKDFIVTLLKLGPFTMEEQLLHRKSVFIKEFRVWPLLG